MASKVIKFVLALIVAFQVIGFANAFASAVSQSQTHSGSVTQVSHVKAISHQDASSEEDDRDSPVDHHHCKNHPKGSCCSFLAASEVSLVHGRVSPSFRTQLNFFFFELVTIRLRPPSFLS